MVRKTAAQKAAAKAAPRKEIPKTMPVRRPVGRPRKITPAAASVLAPEPQEVDLVPPALNLYDDGGAFSTEKARQIYEQSKNWAPEQKKAALVYMRSAAKREEIKSKYRNVAEIAHAVDPNFVITPAITLIAEAIEVALNTPNHNLLISCPPQEGKSTLCSVFAPIRAWQLNPNRRIILATYGEDLALQHSTACRTWIERYGSGVKDPITGGDVEDKIGLKLSGRSKRMDAWRIDGANGGLVAAGIGGAITGRAADCVSGDTCIITEYGRVTAEQAYREQHSQIWAYDHTIGVAGFCPVEASRRINGRRVVTLRTQAGSVLRCTPDHRIYTRRGYVAARDLRPSDQVLSIDRVGGMPSMFDRISSDGGGYSQSDTPGDAPVLLQPMQLGSDRRRLSDSVLCDMFGTNSQVSEIDMFSQMPGSTSSGKTSYSIMSCMPERISAEIIPSSVLQPRMFKHGPFEANDRSGQFQVQNRDKLRELVPAHAADDHGARPIPMRGMRAESVAFDVHTQWPDRREVSTDCSSHQRGPCEQPARESNFNVLNMPYDPSQVVYDAVSSVTELGSDQINVYDFQVDRACNFFANDLLVHNCFIIDDPYKNMQEADSEAHRNKVDEWMRTVAMTRRSPQASIILVQTRWHASDLAGKTLEGERELSPKHRTWRHINIPAIAQEGIYDSLKRKPGVAMISARGRTKEDFEAIHRAVGDRFWLSMYQGSPTNPEGGLFVRKWFEPRLTELPKYPVAAVVGVDPADSGVGDETGILGAVLAGNGEIVFTEDRSGLLTSDQWAARAVELALEINAREIALEGFSVWNTYRNVVKSAWNDMHRAAREKFATGAELTLLEQRAMVPNMPFTIGKYTEAGDAEGRASLLRKDFERKRARVVEYKMAEFESQAADWQTGQHCPDRVSAAVICHWRLDQLGSSRIQYGHPLQARPIGPPPERLTRRISDRGPFVPFESRDRPWR